MRSAILIVAALAVGGVVAATAKSPSAEASPKVCLKFRDLGGLKRVDDRTFIASTKFGKSKYLVKMRSTCRDLDWPDNYYSVRLYSDRECFDGDDVLQFRYGGSCFVESVTPAPAQ
jgi:hypothetical protein